MLLLFWPTLNTHMLHMLYNIIVKITRSGLHLFYFSFDLLLIFLFLEQLGLGSEVIGHTVTSVTI